MKISALADKYNNAPWWFDASIFGLCVFGVGINIHLLPIYPVFAWCLLILDSIGAIVAAIVSIAKYTGRWKFTPRNQKVSDASR